MTTQQPDLVAEIRAEMGRQGITGKRLAEAAGLHQSTVSRRLSGHSPIKLTELLRICDALRIPLATFAQRAEASDRTEPCATDSRGSAA